MRLKQIEGPIWTGLHCDKFTAASCGIFCYTRHNVSLQCLSARKRLCFKNEPFNCSNAQRYQPSLKSKQTLSPSSQKPMAGFIMCQVCPVRILCSCKIDFNIILACTVRLGIPRGILFKLSRLALDVRVCQLMQHVPLIVLIFITYLNIITADINAFWETLSERNASSSTWYRRPCDCA